MALIGQKNNFVSELFKQRNLRPSTASQEELQFARNSLILKKKCQSNIHSLLFCKSNQYFIEQTGKKQKNILLEQKNKYFQYIRKTFKDKIPVQFQSESKLKRTLKNTIKQKKQALIEANNEIIKKRLPPTAAFTPIDIKNKKVKKSQNKIVEDKKKNDESKKTNKQQIYAEQDEKQIQDDNFESQIDLHNDEINEQSYQNEQNFDE